MATDGKIERLRRAPLFSGCSDKALSALASAVDGVTVEAGRTLIRERAVSHEAYLIEEGVAEVLVGDEIVAEIPAGELVGEVSLLTRDVSSATVRAKTDMSVLVIPHNRFDQVAREAPEIGMEMARDLARRLKETDAKLH